MANVAAKARAPAPAVPSSSSSSSSSSQPDTLLKSASSARYAFVTLVTTDSYLPGAVVLARSLRLAHAFSGNPAGTLTPSDIANLGPQGLGQRAAQAHGSDNGKLVDLVCFVTPATVSIETIRVLLRHFDKVVGVEPLSFASLASAQLKLAQADASQSSSVTARRNAQQVIRDTRQRLHLLGRPDLAGTRGAPLTKLHAWRLTGYQKVVFLDADMIVLRPLAHLFSISAGLAASSDIGWPDSFNSGLLVLTPSLETFGAMREFAVSKGSWDGADQGLLNDFFGGEVGSADVGLGGGWQRLPFRYNVTPNAGYTFAPAYQRYGPGIMAAHFIGQQKPWSQARPIDTGSGTVPVNYDSLLIRWYGLLDLCYPEVAATMGTNQAEVVYTERGVEIVERSQPMQLHEAIWRLEKASAERALARGLRSTQTPRPLSIRGAGQVEDLKNMFRPEIVAASAAADLEARSLRAQGDDEKSEGMYLTLPLDGRTSLMPLELDSGDEGDTRSVREEPQSVASQQQESNDDGEWTPPKLTWDPSKESPPAGISQVDYQMRNPVDTYFANAWDLPASGPKKGKDALFRSAMDQSGGSRERTLAKLQREHFFDNLGSEQPDARKVKPIFPWEQQASSAISSSRTFPDEEPSNVVPGSTEHMASLQAATGHAPERRFSDSGEDSAERWQTAQSGESTAFESGNASASSRGAFPVNLSYTNAWDKDDIIRRRVRVSSTSSTKTLTPNSNASVASVDSNRGEKASRGSQTIPHARYRSRGAQADNTNKTGGSRRSVDMMPLNLDTPADQSGDGDNESSSSSEDEVTDARGTTRRREGPGPGYQRKAESLHGAAGTSPRSPRSSFAPPLGSSPNSHRMYGGHGVSALHGSTSQHYDGGLTSGDRSETPHSRSTSYNSEQYLTAASTTSSRNTSGRTRRAAPQIGDSVLVTDTTFDSNADTFYDAEDLSMMMHSSLPSRRPPNRTTGYLRSPHGSLPGSGANSGASSPTSAATPTNLSPRHSRVDLAHASPYTSSSTRRINSRRLHE